MTPEQWQRVKDLLARAMELDTAGQKRLIEQECSDDAPLRDQVFELLNNYTLATMRLPGLGTIQAPAGADASTRPPARPGLVLEPGDLCGRYQVVRLLGAGAMGRVYLAIDTELSTPVALKFLSDELLESSEARIRLRAEAHNAARLRGHPHIATLLDLIHVDVRGRQFPVIVMEYVEGKSCAAHLAEHPVSLKRALRWAAQIADAVEYAHDRGVLHCDLKPQNIQIAGDDSVKVLDFGVSRALYGPSTAEAVTGTPAYMAPEQLTDRRITESSDIYSLGVTIFELVTRQRPFIGDTLEDVVLHILGLPAPRASSIVSDVPPALDTLLGRTLAKVPRQRPQSVAELRRELVGVRDALDPTSAPVSQSRRTWLWAALTACAILAGLTFVGFVSSRAYDAALGRTGRFDDESPLWWPLWGLRMLVAPAALSAGALLVLALGGIVLKGAMGFGGWLSIKRTPADVVASAPLERIATIVFLGGALALLAFVVRFLPVISAIQDLSDTAVPNVAALRPDNYLEHNAYRYSAFVLFVSSAWAWFKIAQRRSRSVERLGVVLPVAGGVVMLVALFLWALPYRLLWQAELQKVRVGSDPCYVAGRQSSEVLLFCPTSSSRTRVIDAEDARLDWSDSTTEKIFTEFNRATSDPSAFEGVPLN